MPSLLLKDVLLEGELTSIFCEEGRIAAIGPHARQDADRVLDGDGRLIAFPPLLNAHTHAAMTLFRGNGDDLPLMEWLTTRVWPYEGGITADEVYWGTKLAILEMIRSGTVFFNDMYWDFHAAARAVEEMGVRATIAAVMLDMGEHFDLASQIERNERLLKEAEQYSNRVRYAVGPHAVYTVSEEGLRWAADFSREHGVLLHTHLAETEKEVADCREQHGCSPTEYMERLGLISERFVAAHTVWLSERDAAILGEHRAVCAHNPVSNLKLAVNGVYPYRTLRDAGAVTALATDGAGSNNNLDLFEEMKIAALLQKFTENDPTALPAVEVLAMATTNPAEAFGVEGGPLREGRAADLILLDSGLPEMTPLHSLESHLAYSANGSVVDSVVCDGRVLMEHRVVEGEEEIRARAAEAAHTLFARVDGA